MRLNKTIVETLLVSYLDEDVAKDLNFIEVDGTDLTEDETGHLRLVIDHKDYRSEDYISEETGSVTMITWDGRT